MTWHWSSLNGSWNESYFLFSQTRALRQRESKQPQNWRMAENSVLIHGNLGCHWALPATQLVKNLPAMRETWVRSLGWEDPLEKGKATHSSILPWRIPWTVMVHGVTKSRTRLSNFHFHFGLKNQERKALPGMQQSTSTSVQSRGSAQASESSAMGPGALWRCHNSDRVVLSFRGCA